MPVAGKLQQREEQQHCWEGGSCRHQRGESTGLPATQTAQGIGAGHRQRQGEGGAARSDHHAVDQIGEEGRIALQQLPVVLECPAPCSQAAEGLTGPKRGVELPEHRAQAPQQQQQPGHQRRPPCQRRLQRQISAPAPQRISKMANDPRSSVAL